MSGRFWEVWGGQNGSQNRFLGRFFSMFFSNAFRHRFLMIFGRLETWKIAIIPKENHDFRKIGVFEKIAKIMDFGSIFGGWNGEKSTKNDVRIHAFFGYRFFGDVLRFLAIFVGFWEAPGPQKFEKNWKNRVLDAFGTRIGFLIDFGTDFGAIWDGFWVDFGRFWEDVWSFLGGFG